MKLSVSRYQAHKGASIALKTRRNDLLSTAERIPQTQEPLLALTTLQAEPVASRVWLVLGYSSKTDQNNCSSPPMYIWLQSSVLSNCSELAVSSAHSLGCSKLILGRGTISPHRVYCDDSAQPLIRCIPKIGHTWFAPVIGRMFISLERSPLPLQHSHTLPQLPHLFIDYLSWRIPSA